MCQEQSWKCRQKHLIRKEKEECHNPHGCFNSTGPKVLNPIIVSNDDCPECKDVPRQTIHSYNNIGKEFARDYCWPSIYSWDEFIVMFTQLAIRGWRSRKKEWEEGGKQTSRPRAWTEKEQHDARHSVLLAMKPEHQPTGGPQSSNPRQDTELENISFYHPRDYNGEGSSKSGDIDTPKTKRPNPSGPEDDRNKGKGKGKATHPDPESQARKSPSPDYSYPAAGFLEQEAKNAERTGRRIWVPIQPRPEGYKHGEQGPYQGQNQAAEQLKTSKGSAPAKSAPSVSTTSAGVHTAGSKPTSSTSTSGPTRRNTGESALSSKTRDYNPFHDPNDPEFNTHKWAIECNNDDLYADPSPIGSKEQSPAPRPSRSSPHVANQSSPSHGGGKERRSRATSKASSKGSIDSNDFMGQFVNLSPARAPTPTHTSPHPTGAFHTTGAPHSSGASHPVLGSHAQHVGTPVHATGQTAARQNTGTASKPTTQSSSSSSRPKQDKSDKGKKLDKGKGPARRK